MQDKIDFINKILDWIIFIIATSGFLISLDIFINLLGGEKNEKILCNRRKNRH